MFLSNNFFFKTINEKYLLKNLNFVNLDIFNIFNIIFSIFLKISHAVIKKLLSIFLSKKIKQKKNKTQFKENMYKVLISLIKEFLIETVLKIIFI